MGNVARRSTKVKKAVAKGRTCVLRNPIAKELGTNQFHQRIVPKNKQSTPKIKHKKRWLEDALDNDSMF